MLPSPRSTHGCCKPLLDSHSNDCLCLLPEKRTLFVGFKRFMLVCNSSMTLCSTASWAFPLCAATALLMCALHNTPCQGKLACCEVKPQRCLACAQNVCISECSCSRSACLYVCTSADQSQVLTQCSPVRSPKSGFFLAILSWVSPHQLPHCLRS